jgi:hypothetical protein
MHHSRKLQIFSWLAAVLVTSLLFYPALNFEYLNFDDQLYIVNDPATKQLSLVNLRTIFLEPFASAWYPLTRLSHAIEFAVFGDNATGTHLINVLLHLMNALILMQVLLKVGRIFRGPSEHIAIYTAALFSCLLFLVHPQHVEAVAWAVQRKELLATFFALLSINMFLEHRRFVTGVFIFLSMLSKTSTVMLPVLFVLMDVATIKPADMCPRNVVRAVWLNRWLIILAMALAALTLLHHQADDALFYNDKFPLVTKMLLYADSSLRGLYHFFTLQAELFHLPISEYVINAGILGLAVLVIVIVLLAFFSVMVFFDSHYLRIASSGLVFYFIALLPVGGLIIFGNFAFGDRYLYFSSLGIYFLVFTCFVVLISKLPNQRSLQAVIIMSVLILSAAFVQSKQVLPKWASTETIWAYDVSKRPDSVFANEQLGQHYLFTGRPELALKHFRAAIDSQSEQFMVQPRTASALYMAEILCSTNQERQAVDVLKQIPKFGGDIREVELLLGSLVHSGYRSCAQEIERWYQR